MVGYSCITCTEAIEGKHVVFEDGRVCITCFEQLFELAIKDEQQYPAHWAMLKIDHRHYKRILSPDLYERYEAKTVEYACPPLERVYCMQTDPPRRPESCGQFLGRFCQDKKCAQCDKCMWYTCLRCEETFSTDTSSAEEAESHHSCDPRKEIDINRRALHGLERGKDYQICPKDQCKRVWALWDGCNHMKCTCGQYFCYVCGVKTSSNYGHYQRGFCPMYNTYSDRDQVFLQYRHWQAQHWRRRPRRGATQADRDAWRDELEQGDAMFIRRAREAAQDDAEADRQDVVPGWYEELIDRGQPVDYGPRRRRRFLLCTIM